MFKFRVLLFFALVFFTMGCAGGGTSLDTGELDETRTSAKKDKNPPGILAVPGADPTEGAAPLVVNFYDLGSKSLGGTIVKWEWNFGNNSTGWLDYTISQGEAIYVYGSPGKKKAKFRVTDDLGRVSTATITITVVRDKNPPLPVPA